VSHGGAAVVKHRAGRWAALSLVAFLAPLGLDAQTVAPAPATAPATDKPAAKSPWSTSASLTFKETFDSNVYLQDAEPDPANVAAADAAGYDAVSAKQGSAVTTILPRFGLDYRPSPAFYMSAAYSPEITYYHSASSEDYLAHRGTLNLGGKMKGISWELLNTANYIDGNDLGPTFARPGDVPAIGGVALRDRREAFVFRNGFKTTFPVGDLFFRPVATTYFHEFQTEQHASGPGWVYENYIDRQEIAGGLDMGYKVARETHLVLGYRFGAQDQGTLLGAESKYDNNYHRVLIGVEGNPAKWLKLSVLGGPDIRNFHQAPIAADFDDEEMIYYVDAAVTLLPTARDSIALAARRFEQPAYASLSMYQDVTYSLTWRHKLNEHFTAGAGFQLYIGDWQPPVYRNDWIYTPSAMVAYNYKRLSAELAYSYDWVEDHAWSGSGNPYPGGREYTRHLVSLGLKYNF
jgi:hypothetical protein